MTHPIVARSGRRAYGDRPRRRDPIHMRVPVHSSLNRFDF